jgi:DNA-binding beta-propeller fold protein YncE
MRLWSATVAVVLALAFGAAPAQAAPFVYVTNLLSNSIFQYDVGAGGALAPLSPPTTATGSPPVAVAVSPDGKNVYVTVDSGRPTSPQPDGECPPSCPGFVGDVFQYDVRADGTLSPKNPPSVEAGNGPEGIAVSPDGQSVYVVNAGGRYVANSVSEYDVGADGSLSPKNPATVDPFAYFPVAVAVNPDGKSVYVAAQYYTVSQFDIGAGGVLSLKDPPNVRSDVGVTPFGLAVSPDGHSVYVANYGSLNGLISQYDVGAGGELSPKNPATVAAGRTPGGVAVSPDGQSVYVTNNNPGEVFQYDVGAGGVLSPKNPPAVAAEDATEGIAVSGDGKSVYVTNASSDSVSQYDIGAGGALSPKSPPMVATGDGPYGVAVSPLVPTSKEQCKNGGWRDFPQFRNQGSCVSYVQTHP